MTVSQFCPECEAAARGPHHIYRSGCHLCQARAVSRSPQFHASMKVGKLTAGYREMLERFDLTHEAVKAAGGHK